MKIFISADIEGVTGINNWDEANFNKPEYAHYRKRMNDEVRAACEGAIAAGATEITVRDAHGFSKNLEDSGLPRPATLIRGWSGHPYSMVQGIDRTYQACLMIGYHARAGFQGNPMAHTMSGKFLEMRLNGKPMSEFLLHTWAAALEGVPTVFVAGDSGLCEDIRQQNENIRTVATTRYFGHTSMTLAHPDKVLEQIRDGVQQTLQAQNFERCRLPLPTAFELELDYKELPQAYRSSFYPGAELVGPRTVRLKTGTHLEVLRAIQFM